METAESIVRSAGSSSSTVERFTLSGRSAPLDPTYDAYRGDLADVALASTHFAPHYVQPVSRIVSHGPLFRDRDASEIIVELEDGEEFALLDITGGWAWGFRVTDHLVGYLPADRLIPADCDG